MILKRKLMVLTKKLNDLEIKVDNLDKKFDMILEEIAKLAFNGTNNLEMVTQIRFRVLGVYNLREPKSPSRPQDSSE